ncbi:Do family serine endopeptidase [Dysgonomonas sp. 216]|uniref:Do family serine endopeptidase n=1 Tax=Dysgonomonas sp. 216 TaxID=2302934 RepID=UPI0013D6AC88|nr:Do family serine endopeptidase [Dysgonomonas sp. 216]NDW19209.1 Do family serine endopeptidase [Dysgonomonas sp. 216]
MKKIWSNLFTYVLVAAISVGATYATYSYLEKSKTGGGSTDIFETFAGQNNEKNLHLASLTAEGYPDFTKVAENSVHGVVHIKSVIKQETRRSQQRMVDPFEYFFGFGDRGYQQQPQQPSIGSGSGVIISKDGYIITNNHVVDKANELEVTLSDNRKFSAKLIGADPTTDIALLKIEGDNYPIIPIGSSDELKVGEWVLAVGNPFNLTSTVTAGIVSAKARGGIGSGNQSSIQSFIQTDAAINPGNSGGALVNTKGELVGINTAIYSQTGSFAGYGFAVPISIAGKVVADLKEYGAVQRAVLGIVITDIANAKEAYPDKTKDIKVTEGVYVNDFADRSPAKEAGLLEGDVIVEVNNIKVRNTGELQDQVSRHRPGDKVKVKVRRGTSDKTYEVVLKNNDGSTSIVKKSDPLASVGAAFNELSSDKKKEYGVSFGVEVAGVDGDGKFKAAGISKGFIILKLNDQPVSTPEDVEKVILSVGQSRDKGLFIAGFYPNGRTRYYAIDLGE